jgi:eukaryotic-like serine/threonine-protein kinase
VKNQPCSECGQLLPPGKAEALCPVCALRSVMEGDLPEVGKQLPSATSFGGFELLEEIARGGMGVVFKARQISLNRIVALKMIVGGSLASPAAIQRFLVEAQAAASLQHPNVVAIHEVGEHDGLPFFSMDYVAGRNLAEILHDGPLAPLRAAGYAKTIAEAVHYAHQRGILHRDLKPANVIIDETGQPRITDFGLAKRVVSNSEFDLRASDLTLSGQVLGSPNYIAPEQAQGRHREVGPGSDVYSLGALLYHLLTGRPPFQAATLTEVLRQVVANEPAAPRLLNPGLPRDLETICLKCLDKDVAHRYPSAQVLADDLGRFLQGEPILARPVGRVAKGTKWCRCNPRLAAALAFGLTSVLAGLAGVSWEWRRAEAQRARAEANEYVLTVNAAQQALKANNPGRTLELLNRYRPRDKAESGKSLRTPNTPEMGRRGFEWRYLWQQCQTEAETVIGKLLGTIWSLEVSADGLWLLATSHGGSVKVWSLSTGEELSLAPERGVDAWATFSPDSRRLFFGEHRPDSSSRIVIWDLEARQLLRPIIDPRPAGPMAFSPDGRWFGYGFAFPSSHKGVWGKGIVLRALPSQEEVREIKSRTDITDLQHATDWVFTPDSRSVIFSEAAPDCQIALCDLVPGSKPRHFPGHREATTAIAINREGVLATGAGYTDTSIKLWEVPSFRLLSELHGHEGWITALRFSPDGRTLASAGADRTIRLWDVASGKARSVFAGLPGEVSRLCFSPDGEKFFSGARNGTILRWSAKTDQAAAPPGFWRRQTELESVTVTLDGRRLAGLRDGAVFLGEVQGSAPPGAVRELDTNNTCLRFSSDGQHLYVGTQNGEVQVWSLAAHRRVRALQGPIEPAMRLREDSQGRVLIAVHWKNEAQVTVPARVAVWSTADWRQARSWTVAGLASGYEVSPDARWLATAGYRQPLQVWDLFGPAVPRTAPTPAGTLGLAFSPDGRMLAAATVAGIIGVWELPGLRQLPELRASSRSVFALAFTPDSRRLATAGAGEEAIKLWDVASWEELITLERPGEQLEELAFSTDGNQLTARDAKGDLRLWRVPSFYEIEAKEAKLRSRLPKSFTRGISTPDNQDVQWLQERTFPQD